jgi:hypothetical protein
MTQPLSRRGRLSLAWTAAAIAAALAAMPAARADLVILDEYWTPEITVNDVRATEVDTRLTGDPTQAKSGECSALLENTVGAPNVRFRDAAFVTLRDLPVGQTEARLWYRTDGWDGVWRMEVWVYAEGLAKEPVKVLEAALDGGGPGGRLIADNQWHQAKGMVREAGEYAAAPKDRRVATFLWLAPVEGWDKPHKTYVDRAEMIVLDGPLAGNLDEPATRVRPRPGVQTAGAGWVWFEAEDAIEHNVPPGGALAPDNVPEQAKLSNGWWLQYHGGGDLAATWQVDVAEAGRYVLWGRVLGAVFSWCWDEGHWHKVTDFPWVDLVHIRGQDIYELEVGWMRMGELDLAAGKHTLCVGDCDPKDAMAFDCWLLTKSGFQPRGTDKPPPP